MPQAAVARINRPDLRFITPDMERRFQVGHQVGAIAQDLEDNGLLIEHETNLTAALQATREALSSYPDRPLFEPAFQHDGLLVQIDLLVPQGTGFQLVEVKSTWPFATPRMAQSCATTASECQPAKPSGPR